MMEKRRAQRRIKPPPQARSRVGYGSAAENGVIAAAVAAAAASAEELDLVLMDIEMPELDGYGATAAIRLSEPLALADLLAALHEWCPRSATPGT